MKSVVPERVSRVLTLTADEVLFQFCSTVFEELHFHRNYDEPICLSGDKFGELVIDKDSI